MSVHGHGETSVKLGYIPSTPFITEPQFIWKDLKLPPLFKFLVGPIQREAVKP